MLACLLTTELLHVPNNLRDATTCATLLNITNNRIVDQWRNRPAKLLSTNGTLLTERKRNSKVTIDVNVNTSLFHHPTMCWHYGLLYNNNIIHEHSTRSHSRQPCTHAHLGFYHVILAGNKILSREGSCSDDLDGTLWYFQTMARFEILKPESNEVLGTVESLNGSMTSMTSKKCYTDGGHKGLLFWISWIQELNFEIDIQSDSLNLNLKTS